MKKLTVVIEGTKFVVGSAASYGAGRIIRYAVDKVVPLTLGKSEKVLIAVGSVAIAFTIGAALATSVGEILDGTVQTIEVVAASIKNSKKEQDLQESLA